tara:strand:- start:242 stop:676 length:435 start_codon:yes stop_codon:yes gene_type:complete
MEKCQLKTTIIQEMENYINYHGHVAFLISPNNKKVIYTGKSKALPYFKNSRGVCSIHAEQNVIKNLKEDHNPYNLLVFRFNKKGQLAMSKPCQNCLKQIKKHKNINTVYYSTEDGIIKDFPVCMEVKECYQSSGFKYMARRIHE